MQAVMPVVQIVNARAKKNVRLYGTIKHNESEFVQ